MGKKGILRRCDSGINENTNEDEFMSICHIVGAGEMGGAKIDYRAGDYLIAADGGYAEVIAQGLKPDLAVGDFDSLGRVPENENVVQHPVMKDDTDMMLAVKLGFEKGYTHFFIYGALGGRLDHTLANIQTLMYIANRGGQGWISGDCCLTAIHNGEADFKESAEGVVSVFCMSEPAKGVSIEGLLYEISDYTMLSDIALGVSNEFTGKKAKVSVKEGTLVLHFGSIEYAEIPR